VNSVGAISTSISPDFPEFFSSVFIVSRKYGIRSVKNEYDTGRYGIFLFPLSSLIVSSLYLVRWIE